MSNRFGKKNHIDGVNVWICDDSPPEIKMYGETAVLTFATVNFFFGNLEALAGWTDQLSNIVMDNMQIQSLDELAKAVTEKE